MEWEIFLLFCFGHYPVLTLAADNSVVVVVVVVAAAAAACAPRVVPPLLTPSSLPKPVTR